MNPFAFLLLLFLSFAVQISIQAGADDWRSRSIYQVVTDRFARSDGSTTSPCDPGLGEYCGGTWQGLKQQLDYIQGMGFTAVWISPVTQNLMQNTSNLQSYHGYWQQDLESLNPAFGTSCDLKDLADALHERNMFLMLDVVVGNMAYAGDPSSVDYSIFNPFDREDYFHPYCSAADAENVTEFRECWLGDEVISLPDLRTEDPVVARMLNDWISEQTEKHSVDGIRIDSVTNMDPEFLSGFNDAANLFCLGEANDKSVSSACGYQKVLDGFLNFPIYFSLTEAFKSSNGKMSDLVDDITNERDACDNLATVGTFSENHDLPRFPSVTSDPSLAENVLTFTMLYEGIPILYYGQEQGLNGSFNPINREALWLTEYDTKVPLYQLTAKLNRLRSEAIKSNDSYLEYISSVIHHDDNTLVLRKGHDGNQIITALTNIGSYTSPLGDDYYLPPIIVHDTGLKEGDIVEDVISCTTATVVTDGELAISFDRGRPRVYYPRDSLTDDDLRSCRDDYGSGDGESGDDEEEEEGVKSVATRLTPW